MKKTTIILIVLMLLALNGCATNNQKQASNNTVTPPVTIPPEVTSPVVTPPVTIPPVTTPPVTTPPATDQGKIVTLDDNNKTITMNIGETFLLKLGENYDWNITIDNQDVLSRVIGILVVRGAQGIYKANTAENAVLTAVGDPPCRKSVPQCGAPSILFKITINVTPKQ